jgi:hypothetical protein
MKRVFLPALLLLLAFAGAAAGQTTQSLSALNACTLPIDLGGYASLGAQLTGTWSGTLQPEVSINAQTPTNTTVTPTTAPQTPQSTITTNNLYSPTVTTGQFILCMTSYSSGTVTINFQGNTHAKGGVPGGGGGSGTVSANSGTAGAVARYAAAGGSTTVAASPDVIDNGTGTLSVGGVGLGTGTALFGGNTSGSGSIGCSAGTCPALTTSLALFVGAGGVKAVAASGFESQGTTFTSSGGCAEATLVGGATAGTFITSGSTSCSTVITMGNTTATTNGWACQAYDLTTAADYHNPTVQPTSGTTITIATGTIVAGDKIQFACVGY